MPPEFQHITFAHCCETAEEVRNKYGQSQEIPINIDHLIEIGVGIEIVPMDGLRNDLDIYGFLSNDRSTIFVDSGMMITQKFEAALRFTMAHELGHYFLHRDFYETNRITTAKDWKTLLSQIDGANLVSYEDQADEFAGRLLIPLTQLISELSLIVPSLFDFRKRNEAIYKKEEFEQLLIIVIAEELFPKFNVPFEVMHRRLEREKINPLEYINNVVASQSTFNIIQNL